MGTVLSKDPWSFYIGFYKDGKYIQSAIPAVHEPGQGATMVRDGRTVRLPFGNGMYQMLSFQNSSMGRPADEGTRNVDWTKVNMDVLSEGGKDVVVPLPQKGIANISLSLRETFFQDLSAIQQIDQEISPFPKKIPAELFTEIKTTELIENPAQHDVFSTDCVSCHKTTSNVSALKKEFDLYGSLFLGEGKYARKSTDAEIKTFFGKNPSKFVPSGNNTAVVHPAFLQIGRYNIINFGYFSGSQGLDNASEESNPSISKRTVNESSLAADITNRDFLQISSLVKRNCNYEELDQCLDVEAGPNVLTGRGTIWNSKIYGKCI